jgi:hypothetical protein
VAISGGLMVDEYVAPLVVALNAFERVSTLDSCEGRDGAPAYVYFTYQGDTHALVSFLHDLYPLRLTLPGDTQPRTSGEQTCY